MRDIATEPATRWWATQADERSGSRPDLSDPVVAGRVVHAALRAGLLDLPAPGSGRTGQRWSVLAALAAADVTLAKLGEAHADAVVILDELAGPEPGDALWGVWAARTPTLRATPDPTGPDLTGPDPTSPDGTTRWRLSGTKPYASGYGCCDRALVTAATESGDGLFAVDPGDPGVTADESSWPAIAMSGTRSLTLTFTDVPGQQVGPAGGYVARPGFWWGGAGIASCWYGGAVGVAQPLYDRVARDQARPAAAPGADFRAAHLGAVHAALAATAAALDAAADHLETRPMADDGFVAALTVRAVAEFTAGLVVDRVGRALGPGPLAADRAHARRVADLQLFVRQSHAEADLAELGSRVAAVPR